MIFVSQPTEPHRMRNNPKGLMLNRILFKIPHGDETVLGLPAVESRWLVHELTHFTEKNHSPAFVKLMDERLPRWRELRKELNSFIAAPMEGD